MHLPLCNIEQISFGCDGEVGVRRVSVERNHPGSWAVFQNCCLLLLMFVSFSSGHESIFYIQFGCNARHQDGGKNSNIQFITFN